MSEERAKTVVVGVDGSPCGEAAIRWAVDFARHSDLSLTLVTVWHWPTSYGVPIPFDNYYPEEDARKMVEAAAADVQLPAARVSTLVEQGAAGDLLVRASNGAAALVVGTRGHGALTGALLGSTSTYCVHHAQCPVVVVR